jgi:hypothetical protein
MSRHFQAFVAWVVTRLGRDLVYKLFRGRR